MVLDLNLRIISANSQGIWPRSLELNDDVDIMKALISVVNLVLSAHRSSSFNSSPEVNDHMLVTLLNRYLLD